MIPEYTKTLAVFLAILLSLATACQKAIDVNIHQDPAGPLKPGGLAQISISVRRPPPDAVYRWLATQGHFEPHETADLYTVYHAPTNSSGSDVVELQILTQGRPTPLWRKEFKISIISDSPAPQLGTDWIEITEMPPYDEAGGPNTRADVRGRVYNVRPDHNLVIYACTIECFVQPQVDSPITTIDEDGTFSNWTHTGSHYAVLLTPAGFRPKPVLSSPEEHIDGVLARFVFEGQR